MSNLLGVWWYGYIKLVNLQVSELEASKLVS